MRGLNQRDAFAPHAARIAIVPGMVISPLAWSHGAEVIESVPAQLGQRG